MRIRLLAVAALVVGCGSPTKPLTIDSFFPRDHEVGAWVENTAVGKAGVETAKTRDEVFALIDGDAELFVSHGFVAFATQDYSNGAMGLSLRVWQLKDSAASRSLYDALVVEPGIYRGYTWTEVTVAEAGRIADIGSSWWLDSRKASFIIDAKVHPKDSTSRAEAEAMVAAVAAKIP